MVNQPQRSAKIYHIDVDPLKEQMPLWHIPAHCVCRADAATALSQINERLERTSIDAAAVAERNAHYASLHDTRQKTLLQRERPDGDVITPEYLTACVRQHLDQDAIVLNEGITSVGTIFDHLGSTRPGSVLASGGGALGWSGGAAIGVKLAKPEKTVVCLTGDGTYMFSVPSSVHWMARRYQTPFLQVIYNNRGWRAPKVSMLAVHPDGFASKAADIDVGFDPSPDYSGIAAAAGGAFAKIVRRPDELSKALADALKAVRHERRCAVLDVWLPHL